MQLLILVVSLLAGVSLVTSTASQCYQCSDANMKVNNATQSLLSTSALSNGQCGDPFNKNGGGVIRVLSNNGWCVKLILEPTGMSVFARGVPNPGICSSSGCRKQTVQSIPATICCCSSSLCNAAPRLGSTMTGTSIVCLVILAVFGTRLF